MRLYTSIILFVLLSIGQAVNSFDIEYKTSAAYTAVNGQVSEAGEKPLSPGRGRK